MELENLLLETACNVANHVIEHARGVIQQQLQVKQYVFMLVCTTLNNIYDQYRQRLAYTLMQPDLGPKYP